MRIELTQDQIDGEKGNGLDIFVSGFRHDPTSTEASASQVFIEVYGGKLHVRVWDGTSEDPSQIIVIEPELEPEVD